jgi:hypothetical protein
MSSDQLQSQLSQQKKPLFVMDSTDQYNI